MLVSKGQILVIFLANYDSFINNFYLQYKVIFKAIFCNINTYIQFLLIILFIKLALQS